MDDGSVIGSVSRGVDKAPGPPSVRVEEDPETSFSRALSVLTRGLDGV